MIEMKIITYEDGFQTAVLIFLKITKGWIITCKSRFDDEIGGSRSIFDHFEENGAIGKIYECF